MSDKALGQMFHMSLRCICLLVTAIILLTVVGWLFVALQAIWTADLRAEVDQLAATNDLLEANNERFRSNNARLTNERERLRDTIDALNFEVGNYSQLNDDLGEEIELLGAFTAELENTVVNTTDQTTLLLGQVDSFAAQVPNIQQTIANLNATSQSLEDELQLLRELEQNIGTFSNSSRDSFDEIRQTTENLYDQVVDITTSNMDTVLQNMANNLEFSEETVLPISREGFTEGEYNTWLSHIAFVLPQTQEELAQQYPFRGETMSSNQITNVIRQIVSQEKRRLEAQSQQETLGFFEDTPIQISVISFVDDINRKMLVLF